MIKLSMYIDGSEVLPADVKKKQGGGRAFVGWGIRAHDETGTREISQAVHKPTMARGLHEELAYVSAVRIAEKLGYIPSEVAIYTDCQTMAYGSFHLCAANRSTQKWRLINRLRRLQKEFFPHDHALVIRTIRWLMGAHNQWVKGHAACVEQRRVDHLARVAAKRASGRASMIEPYEHWLKAGHVIYHGDNNPVRVDWPFVCCPETRVVL